AHHQKHASAGTGSNIVNSINELQCGLSRTGVILIKNATFVDKLGTRYCSIIVFFVQILINPDLSKAFEKS
ncbi:hypothetical protein ACG9XX_13130, partial [Acinetobacter baumannii]